MARWQCAPASVEDLKLHPEYATPKVKCDANMEFTTCQPEEPLTCKVLIMFLFKISIKCHNFEVAGSKFKIFCFRIFTSVKGWLPQSARQDAPAKRDSFLILFRTCASSLKSVPVTMGAEATPTALPSKKNAMFGELIFPRNKFLNISHL